MFQKHIEYFINTLSFSQVFLSCFITDFILPTELCWPELHLLGLEHTAKASTPVAMSPLPLDNKLQQTTLF